ncbi:A24 family peptidase [Yimella sp. cx-51]|uniref:prepilin peptidase n=1 Tax=Yimella sp. cx-51 TaxID=2770551 RepID=UPI00165D485C|nr:A24 family peptidase [Yimella sp. cx-51]MBC9955813.1 prepilin peptidase [Yimella sp. cx-51]QTH37634.1 prepilin peptidase [Yimella sp. cx-51]
MIAAIGFAALGLLLGFGARHELTAGRWRRQTDIKPVPGFGWVLVIMPVVLAVIGHHTARLSWWSTPAYAVLTVVGVVLTAVDADVHRLPDRLTLPAMPIIAALLLVASYGVDDWSRLGRASISTVIVGVTFFVLVLASPSGIGLGDAKLAVLLAGALGWLGWTAVLAWLFYGFLLGGLWALALLITRRATRKTYIAFGPPLLIGAALAILNVSSL